MMQTHVLMAIITLAATLGLGCDPTPVEDQAVAPDSVPSLPTVTQLGREAALAVRWTVNGTGFVAIDRSWPGCGGTCHKNVLWSATTVRAWVDRSVSYDVPYSYKVYTSAGHNGYSAAVTPIQAAAPTEPAVPTGPAAPPEPAVPPVPTEPAVPTGPAVPTVPVVAQVDDELALALSWSGGDDGFVAVDRSWPGCGGTCYKNVLWSTTPRNAWIDRAVSYDVPYRYKVYTSAGHNGYSAPVTAVKDADSNPGPDPNPGPGPSSPTGSLLPPGQWDQVWADEFNGAADAPPAAHWILGPAWAAGPRKGTHSWRDAVTDPGECYLDGAGHLVLRARVVSGERRVCYLSTADNPVDPSKWTTFGPGAKGTYIEFRANVSKMRAHAAWFAMWLMSPGDTYDGKPETGSEIDVMEYVPFEGPAYSLNNLFHSAVHWDLSGGSTQPPHKPPFADQYGQVSAKAYGADLTADTYHTWGVEWYGDEQRFYFNGKLFWTNKTGVSDADNHGLRLTIEVDNGGPFNIWGHAVGAFEDNPSSRLPSFARVDHVRVFRKR